LQLPLLKKHVLQTLGKTGFIAEWQALLAIMAAAGRLRVSVPQVKVVLGISDGSSKKTAVLACQAAASPGLKPGASAALSAISVL
jgi:hypothetical protein